MTAGAGGTFLTMDSQPGDYIGEELPISTRRPTAPSPRPPSRIRCRSRSRSPASPGRSTSRRRIPARWCPGLPRCGAWPFQIAGFPRPLDFRRRPGFQYDHRPPQVTQAVYDTSGNLISFAASFVQYADGATGALTGQVAFDCTDPLPGGMLATTPIPTPARPSGRPWSAIRPTARSCSIPTGRSRTPRPRASWGPTASATRPVTADFQQCGHGDPHGRLAGGE